MNDVQNALGDICREISNISVSPIDTTLPLDEDKIKWYSERFDRVIEDGVPSAITLYLEKLMQEEVNEHTLGIIMYEATQRLGNVK